MARVHSIFMCFWEVLLLQAQPVVVRLQADVGQLREGEPVLLKVCAVNRSDTAISFSPPLRTLNRGLQFECLPPGDAEYRKIEILSLGQYHPASPTGWESQARYASYDYFFRQQVWHSIDARDPPRGVPRRYLFSTEGDWHIRAVVIAGAKSFRSAPVRIRVRGKLAKPAADALEVCSKPLSNWFELPFRLPEDDDVVMLGRHAPALAESTAATPIRLSKLLHDICQATTPKARMEAVTHVKEFRANCSPIQKEYTDLMLGVALVKSGDLAAARTLLKDITEMSSLKQYLEYETRAKE